MKTPISALGRTGVVLATAALLVTGCTNTSAKDDTANTGGDTAAKYETRMVNVSKASGDPVDGGTLRVAEYSEARTLDPTVTYPTGSTGGNVMAAVYDTLVRFDPVDDKFEPQLAESIDTPDKGKTWNIGLREGVKFTDGTPLDADAVVASMQRYMNTYALNATLIKDQVTKLTAVDPKTVKIEMKNAWPRFPNSLTNGAGMILAPAAYKNPAKFQPIGAGPFKFESYAPAEKTVVVANEDYWGGRPHFDKIEFVLLGTDQASYESMKSGGVDVSYLRNAETIDKALNDKASGIFTSAGLSNNLWINTVKGRPGQDKRVRQALAMAFDPVLFAKRVDNGAGNPTKLMLGDQSKWSPGLEEPAVDPKGAKKVLDEAKADGFDGKITFLARNDQSSQAAAVTVKAMWEAVGFDVKLDLLANVADQVERIYVKRDFDVAVVSTNLSDGDLFGRLSSALASNSGVNVSGYNSPEMDGLIKELQAAQTPEEGKPTVAKIEKLWAEDAPGVAIDAGGTINAWNKGVHGVVPTGENILLFQDAWKKS